MRTDTDHQSFIVKPSTVKGVGVFILHDAASGTHLELFTDKFEEELRDAKDVPGELKIFCLGHEGGKILCPKDFNRMEIGNYLNHSNNSNIRYEKGAGYFARRDIVAGEELLADYRELGEPDESREEYYKT